MLILILVIIIIIIIIRIIIRPQRAIPRIAQPRCMEIFGRGDDTVGNPHRARISQFELFEFIPLLKLDKQFPVERFEPTVS